MFLAIPRFYRTRTGGALLFGLVTSSDLLVIASHRFRLQVQTWSSRRQFCTTTLSLRSQKHPETNLLQCGYTACVVDCVHSHTSKCRPQQAALLHCVLWQLRGLELLGACISSQEPQGLNLAPRGPRSAFRYTPPRHPSIFKGVPACFALRKPQCISSCARCDTTASLCAGLQWMRID